MLAAMGKTVSNIPVIIVAVMERQARLSRHCLRRNAGMSRAPPALAYALRLLALALPR